MMLVLSELGVTRDDPEVREACEYWMDDMATQDGGLGGNSKGRPHYCVAANQARAVIRMGYADDSRVRRTLEWLVEIADHYEKLIRGLEEPPILMGHSMGGLTVQILLDRGLGAAGVAIESATPKGIYRLPLSTIKATNPVLSNPLNFKRNVTYTFEQFHYTFANVMPENEARAAYDTYAIPGPGRPIFQVAFGNFVPNAENTVNYGNNLRSPLLLIVGAEDHLVPPIVVKINHKNYAHSTAITEFKEFPHRSHLIIAQEGWQEVAEYALSWAVRQTMGEGLRAAA
jgi:pimeloyl-ACP methyl ester carboxylesterase